MNQKYSIMLLGQLFSHFLLLLNVETKPSCCWKRESHSTTCLQTYPNRLCPILGGSSPELNKIFVELVFCGV